MWADIVQLFVGLDISDLTVPVSILMWAVLVMLPISQTDHRDIISGITYTLFLTAAGITLTLAIPQRFTELPSPGNQAIIILLMMVIATLRWFWRAEPSAEKTKIDKLIEENKG